MKPTFTRMKPKNRGQLFDFFMFSNGGKLLIAYKKDLGDFSPSKFKIQNQKSSTKKSKFHSKEFFP